MTYTKRGPFVDVPEDGPVPSGAVPTDAATFNHFDDALDDQDTRITTLEEAPGGGVTDHGALTGLADDDHTQYHNDTRGDARYSQLGHDHPASDISYTGPLASDNVQGAVDELIPAVSDDRGDTDITLVASDNHLQRFATELTAPRTITLPTTGLYDGLSFTIVREALGEYLLDVGGVVSLPSTQPATARVVYDGGAWRLVGVYPHAYPNATTVNFSAALDLDGGPVQDALEQEATHRATHVSSTTAHDAANITTTPPSGQATWDDAQTYLDGLKTLVDAIEGGGAGVDYVYSYVPLGSMQNARQTWSAMPAAETEYRGGTTFHRNYFDATGAEQVAIIADVGTVGAAGATLRGQYYDGTNWVYLDGTAAGGSGTPSLPIASSVTPGISSFVNLATGAKQLRSFRAVGVGGDGVASPTFGNVGLLFKIPVSGSAADIPIQGILQWRGALAEGNSLWAGPWMFTGVIDTLRFFFGTAPDVGGGNVTVRIDQRRDGVLTTGIVVHTVSAGEDEDVLTGQSISVQPQDVWRIRFSAGEFGTNTADLNVGFSGVLS
jgi:hypothetical protein